MTSRGLLISFTVIRRHQYACVHRHIDVYRRYGNQALRFYDAKIKYLWQSQGRI